MKFEEFRELCHTSGVRARDCGNGHWQAVSDHYLVNFYPSSQTVYIHKDTQGFTGSASVAIGCAKSGKRPPPAPTLFDGS